MCKIERILESEGFGGYVIGESYLLVWKGEISSSHTDKSATYMIKGDATPEQFSEYYKELAQLAAKYPEELSVLSAKQFFTIDDLRTDSTEPLIRF